MVKKYNYKTGAYEPYELPKGACQCAETMDTEIACATCAQLIKFGDSYTSLRVHGEFGIAYMVCEECYAEELELVSMLAQKGTVTV